MDKALLSILKKNRQIAHRNPKSILKKYDEYLETHGIYHSLNSDIFAKSIKGHVELADGILALYNIAKLENERILLLEDLLTIGYDKNKLVELILAVFNAEESPDNLWEYGDLLYSIKNFRYMSHYLDIIKNKAFGEARQMLIILVGKSKRKSVIPVLTELLDDPTVFGHALDALSNFSGVEIDHIMRKYMDYNVAWVQKIAVMYFSKGRQTGDGLREPY